MKGLLISKECRAATIEGMGDNSTAPQQNLDERAIGILLSIIDDKSIADIRGYKGGVTIPS